MILKQDRLIEMSVHQQVENQKRYSDSIKSRMKKEISTERFIIETIHQKKSLILCAEIAKGSRRNIKENDNTSNLSALTNQSEHSKEEMNNKNKSKTSKGKTSIASSKNSRSIWLKESVIQKTNDLSDQLKNERQERERERQQMKEERKEHKKFMVSMKSFQEIILNAKDNDTNEEISLKVRLLAQKHQK